MTFLSQFSALPLHPSTPPEIIPRRPPDVDSLVDAACEKLDLFIYVYKVVPQFGIAKLVIFSNNYGLWEIYLYYS